VGGRGQSPHPRRGTGSRSSKLERFDAVSGLDRLSPRDTEIVRECLAAAVNGPFFPEWEFRLLIGLERYEVERVLGAWPDRSNSDDQDLAVNNVLNNLLGYPHHEDDAWAAYISSERSEVASILARWRGDDHFELQARGYFDRLR
jgi:hypothetical protein